MALWHLLMRSGCRWAPPSQRQASEIFTLHMIQKNDSNTVDYLIYIYIIYFCMYTYIGIFVTNVWRSFWILKNFAFNLRHIQAKQHLTLIDTPLFFAPAQALKVSHRKGPNSACLAMSLWLHMKERNLGRGASKTRFPFHEQQVLGKRMLLKRQRFRGKFRNKGEVSLTTNWIPPFPAIVWNEGFIPHPGGDWHPVKGGQPELWITIRALPYSQVRSMEQEIQCVRCN